MLNKAAENPIAVSVIVAVHNAEAYLKQCLDSIREQTLQNIEIICVDDGSTDESFKILKEYEQQDDRVRIIQQEQQGAGSARNHGLRYARGTYLSFLDADDFFEKDFLESMYKRAIQTQADIVVCAANEYDHQTGKIRELPFSLNIKNLPAKQIFSYRDIPDTIFNTFQNWAWNKLFRAEFVRKNNLKFQELQRTNDLVFTCMALVCAKKITTVENAFVYYRVNHGGNCQSNNERAPFDFYKAFIELKRQLNDKQICDVVRSSYQTWALKSCIYNVFSIKNSSIRHDVCSFLTQEGLAQLEITQMKVRECSRTMDKFELVCVQHGWWKILNREQQLKVWVKQILKK